MDEVRPIGTITEDELLSRADIALRIAAFARVPELAPDEITVMDYAGALKVCRMTADRELETQVRLGKLTKRQVYDPRIQRNVKAFKRAM